MGTSSNSVGVVQGSVTVTAYTRGVSRHLPRSGGTPRPVAKCHAHANTCVSPVARNWRIEGACLWLSHDALPRLWRLVVSHARLHRLAPWRPCVQYHATYHPCDEATVLVLRRNYCSCKYCCGVGFYVPVLEGLRQLELSVSR